MDGTGKHDAPPELTAELPESALKLLHAAPAPQWPFSRPALLAGLRRHLDAPNLRLREISPRPLPRIVPDSSFTKAGTTLSAMSVGVTLDGDEYSLALLLKEPPVTPDGRVLTAVGEREYGIYRRLAPHLPMLVPSLVAGDPYEGWIVIEGVSAMRPMDAWEPDDYREALLNLVKLHDRFWGAGEDLLVFPWLARPFEADYDATVQAAVEAVEGLTQNAHLPGLQDARYQSLFRTIAAAADRIAEPLREEKMTLVHGDYWPGNIARQIDGRMMVFDWQLAGIAPGVLDFVGFVQATRMHLLPEISIGVMVDYYREQCEQYVKPGWDDDRFEQLWDHALLWRFLAYWLPRLAMMQPQTYLGVQRLFSAVWLEPLFRAAEKRLLPHPS